MTGELPASHRGVARLAQSWTMDAPDELLKAAVEITRVASALAARRFLEGVPAGNKTDGTEVTAADIEVEELVRSLIAARFPGDGMAGEELPAHPIHGRVPVLRQGDARSDPQAHDGERAGDDRGNSTAVEQNGVPS